MILVSEDMSQEAEKVSTPQKNVMKGECWVRKDNERGKIASP